VAEPLQQVWIALRVNLRAVLENVSLADIAANGLPEFIGTLTADPGAWVRREPHRTDPPKITGRPTGADGSVRSSC
jgi:hypothetical protein